MNRKAIKQIYINILIYGCTIKYLGKDKNKLIGWHDNGQKRWEAECKNEKLHGKFIEWDSYGQKTWEHNYENGNGNYM